MRAESLLEGTAPDDQDVAPKRYLRALLAVARSPRRREYVVIHPGSGSFFRTDRLGALVARALIGGRSDVEAMELVERIEAGAGKRGRRLIFALNQKGVLSPAPPRQNDRRMQMRRLVAVSIGLAFSVIGRFVRITPTVVLAWLYSTLLSSPVGRARSHAKGLTTGSDSPASGPGALDQAPDVRPSRSFNYLFLYLCIGLSPQRLGRLVNHLFDRAAAENLAVRLESDGPTVAAFLHGPLCVAVPNVLRSRGREVVRVVVPWSHGHYVSEASGPLGAFFGDSFEMAVPISDPVATGALLRHLKAGRNVYISLDDLPSTGYKQTAEVEMLGRWFFRNDAPAWLAVRSGRPLALWTTHSSPSGIVLEASPLLHPDLSLPMGARVADLSKRLYAYAEAAIREHPEGWRYWSYINIITGDRPMGAPARSASGVIGFPAD